MSSRRFFSILFIAIAALTINACKHDDDDTTKTYLDGTLSFTVPPFMGAGDSHVCIPTGISNPDSTGVGYYWKVSDVLTTADTVKLQSDNSNDGRFTYYAYDSLANFTITCGAFAEGYYSSTATGTVTVVNPVIGKSLTETYLGGNNYYQDTRDNDRYQSDYGKYYYQKIGNHYWMRNNLAYKGLGVPYEDCDVMSYIFGRYYTWNEAMKACPDGWRLPTEADWVDMADATAANAAFQAGETFPGISGNMMVDAYFNGVKLWEYWPAVVVTNSSKFGSMPFGYAVISGDTHTFSGVNDYAVFWTATSKADDDTKAVYRYMNVNKPDVYAGYGDKESFAASVRCIKDID